MRDEDCRENPMILDHLWKTDAYGRTEIENEPELWCDRCGCLIKDEDDSYEIADESICQDCWQEHIDLVGGEE